MYRMICTVTILTQKEREVHARRAMVRSLYDGGASVQEIADILKVTRSAVYQMLKTLNLPAPTERDQP